MKRFVRLREVLSCLGVSQSTLYEMMRRGQFPRPAKIGKMSVWPEDEVDAWQQACLRARDEQTA